LAEARPPSSSWCSSFKISLPHQGVHPTAKIRSQKWLPFSHQSWQTAAALPAIRATQILVVSHILHHHPPPLFTTLSLPRCRYLSPLLRLSTILLPSYLSSNTLLSMLSWPRPSRSLRKNLEVPPPIALDDNPPPPSTTSAPTGPWPPQSHPIVHYIVISERSCKDCPVPD
jgi:hypothetical protein